jgi:hypothetical protein
VGEPAIRPPVGFHQPMSEATEDARTAVPKYVKEIKKDMG